MTLLYRDELFLRHDTGRHVEVPARLASITARLDRAGLPGRCRPGTYSPLTPAQVAEVHAPGMIQRVREVAEDGGGRLDPDTVVSPASYEVALAAAGAAASAVDGVLG